VGFGARASTAAERSGSQVTAASTCLALKVAAAAGASWVKMIPLLDRGAVVGGEPGLGEQVEEEEVRGVNWVQAILWPFQVSIDLIEATETMPSPPRDQSCMMTDFALVFCSARIEASRAQCRPCPHVIRWIAFVQHALAAVQRRNV